MTLTEIADYLEEMMRTRFLDNTTRQKLRESIKSLRDLSQDDAPKTRDDF